MRKPAFSPGPIILFGSGEISPSGRRVYESLFRRLSDRPRVALLETPAGFELNSAQVIGRVADFISHHLQNYQPRMMTVAARQRGTKYSPDNPDIVEPLYGAEVIFMGPGSPTFAVRQLQNSLAWEVIQARHRLGAAIVLASAAVVAVSAMALPVYEIYKVGEDLHWKPGLDLFGSFGLGLVFIPHWNNSDGGRELDTSRCFMGRQRFVRLVEQLPPGITVVGIDEATALVVDPEAGQCEVQGRGGVSLIHTGDHHLGAEPESAVQLDGLVEVVRHLGGHVHRFDQGQRFELTRLGPFKLPEDGEGLDEGVWAQALKSGERSAQNRTLERKLPPPDIAALLEARQAARDRQDWAEADALRDQIIASGWIIRDTPDGPELLPGDHLEESG